ncbi:NRAMP family divalent metal transporter [Dyadobacter tibetensis]|uniref:NRAMP family divalent metal transporter n=1 Tax=Dyadobacter tibetensis TaxID=1211851 RepID=UPI000472A8A5|nr:NRAMP family divalent metal transporter [Dyadobacter tibetensis]
MIKRNHGNRLLGAAFLMATSAVGPGFLTQTTVFTQKLTTSFGFVILLSVLIDLCVQYNIWQIIVVSGKRAQDLANELYPGLGYVLALLVVIGGLAFNIGNLAGAGLGIEALTGIPVKIGAGISALIAISIFLFKEAGQKMDLLTKILGLGMILLILVVAFIARPPLALALRHSIVPQEFDALATITLVGGTVGGYISFAGAHRLLDSGFNGTKDLSETNRGAGTAILLTAVIRYLLFLATLGVVLKITNIDAGNPTASVFENATGSLGRQLFGLMIWSAAITSVIGAAYTSLTFLRSFHPLIEKYQEKLTIVFILMSAVIFLLVGTPVKVLIWVGTLNGFVLPFALFILLIAVRNKRIMGNYQHPKWLSILGWMVVLLLLWLGIEALGAYKG